MNSLHPIDLHDLNKVIETLDRLPVHYRIMLPSGRMVESRPKAETASENLCAEVPVRKSREGVGSGITREKVNNFVHMTGYSVILDRLHVGEEVTFRRDDPRYNGGLQDPVVWSSFISTVSAQAYRKHSPTRRRHESVTVIHDTSSILVRREK